jgi:hypothetical protein
MDVASSQATGMRHTSFLGKLTRRELVRIVRRPFTTREHANGQNHVRTDAKTKHQAVENTVWRLQTTGCGKILGDT